MRITAALLFIAVLITIPVACTKSSQAERQDPPTTYDTCMEMVRSLSQGSTGKCYCPKQSSYCIAKVDGFIITAECSDGWCGYKSVTGSGSSQ